ncbi:hypothetical protein [Bdellovibrio sp. GT3]|uniref:hypothetical protein n=1 Tax=Bdellovibrio sp. GT3 TaxID=3136282 RepID=UPI0030F0C144
MLILKSKLKHELHLKNLLNTIAAPIGHCNEYRYETKFISAEIDLTNKNQNDVIYGIELDETFIPIRTGKVLDINNFGDFHFFNVQLGNFISHAELSKTSLEHLAFQCTANYKEISVRSTDWSNHLSHLSDIIKNKGLGTCCFLHLEIFASDSEDNCHFDEKRLSPKNSNCHSIYQPKANIDYYINIVCLFPSYTGNSNCPTFSVDIPTQAGSHHMKEIVISSKCNRTVIPLNFSSIKDHPLGSIVISSKSNCFKTPTISIFYKMDYLEVYCSILAMTLTIVFLKAIMIGTTSSNIIEHCITTLQATFLVSAAYKFREKIS